MDDSSLWGANLTIYPEMIQSFADEIIMNVPDKILLFLSAILCGFCRKELLNSQKKNTLRVNTDRESNQSSAAISYNPLQDRRAERKAMKKQLVLVIPILAAMIGMFAIAGLNSVTAQNMSTPETNYTSGTNMTNSTMAGNMTSGNATSGNMAGPTNMTSP